MRGMELGGFHNIPRIPCLEDFLGSLAFSSNGHLASKARTKLACSDVSVTLELVSLFLMTPRLCASSFSHVLLDYKVHNLPQKVVFPSVAENDDFALRQAEGCAGTEPGFRIPSPASSAILSHGHGMPAEAAGLWRLHFTCSFEALWSPLHLHPQTS